MIKLTLKRFIEKILHRLEHLAAKSYIAGSDLRDALSAVKRLESRGIRATLGYFDSPTADNVETVMRAYMQSLQEIRGQPHYLSIKFPAIAYDLNNISSLLRLVAGTDARIHLDAMWPSTVDPTKLAVESIGPSVYKNNLGFTLPGRWKRSAQDALWAIQQGLRVRVVKGQWEDPDFPNYNASTGFLEVIKVLAGNVPMVAVATHDLPLAKESIQILKAKNTACELELLYGLPMQNALALAADLDVRVRVYVPFGKGYLPYALNQAVKKPIIFWWFLKDFLSRYFTPEA